MVEILLGAIIALLLVIIALLVGLIIQIRKRHQDMIEWLDAYAEMVGEAIDKIL